MKESEILSRLKKSVEEAIVTAERYSKLDADTLNWSKSEGSWNAFQCFEHINRYGEFYLKECNYRIAKAKASNEDKEFVGSNFATKTINSMYPQEDMVKPMNTFKSKNPKGVNYDYKVIKTFIEHQNEWLTIIENASRVDLMTVKTKLTLPIIKFKLGDTLQFVIAHQTRHLWQADNAINKK